jgi:photosystem II stability/assembly factor-like uncharacterized protein
MLARYLKACLACLVLAAPVQAIEKGETYDVLNLPAPQSSRATESNLYGIARAGSRLVAVGQRGIVLYSDDQGRSWTQGQVPVRSVLLDVFFVNDKLGWAVGHDGVILHSADGGESWVKQLDGYQLIDIGLAYYGRLVDENPDNEAYAIVLGEFEFAAEQGADKPFLMVYFADEKQGFAMGAYGFAVATEDGGANWVPIMEHGPLSFLHVFDYEIVGERFFLTQEMGHILTGQVGQTTSVASIIPFYDGSFYTMVSSEQGDLVVAGLRATTFRSEDGAQTWDLLDLPTSASVNASTRLADGRIVLVSQNGEVLVSDDDGRTFDDFPLDNTFPFSDVIETDPGQLVLVGLGGVLSVSLDQ